MALLTAEDVLNKAFSKTKYREGFDQDEVDDFLDEVAHTISSLTAERDDLAQRLAQAQAGAPAAAPSAPSAPEPSATTGEAGLLTAATDPNPPSATGMLAMAQKLHDEYVSAGEDERDRIIEDAKSKAESIVERAEADAKTRMDELVGERGDLERKIDDLRRFERDYRARLKSYLENLLGDLDHGASEASEQSAPSFGGGFGGLDSEQTSEDTAADSESSAPSEESPWQSGSAASAEDAPAQEEQDDERPAPAPSPWAQVRPQDQADATEEPAPWGASTYVPRQQAPSRSEVSQVFGQQDEGDTQR